MAKRHGTKIVFTAGTDDSNVVTDPDGILIGLRVPDGATAATLTFEEVIGDPRPADIDDLVTVPLTLKDGTTAYSVAIGTSGALIMFGGTAGVANSPLPLRTFRLHSSATQVAKLTIIPVYQTH